MVRTTDILVAYMYGVYIWHMHNGLYIYDIHVYIAPIRTCHMMVPTFPGRRQAIMPGKDQSCKVEVGVRLTLAPLHAEHQEEGCLC